MNDNHSEEMRAMLAEIETVKQAFEAENSTDDTYVHLVHAAELNVRLLSEIDHLLGEEFIEAAE